MKTSLRSGADAAQSCLAGGGEMGARMRAIDWASTELGPVHEWPESLKTCVRIILTSAQPMFVWWGDNLINLYNDAYKSIVGGKHPGALGQPASQVWHEIWDQAGPRAASSMLHNEGTYDEALLLIMERNGYAEETYYTFSYSPVPNDQGGTGGLICANTDDTQRIIGGRQLALLRELDAATADAQSAVGVCEGAARAIGSEPRDLTFAAIYLRQEGQAGSLLRAATVGIEALHPAVPREIAPNDATSLPLFEALADHELTLVETSRLAWALPAGAWQRAPQQLAVVPLLASGQTGQNGVLIAGLNPFRLFDDGYRGFVTLLSGQIAAAIARVEAHAQEKRRAEELAALNRAKTAFFSNISHEFRTPLTLMLGPLEDALASSERTLSAENLEIAHRNARRLLNLVNALLDFSRLEAGRIDASFAPTDLGAVTAELVSGFRSAIERAGLTLEVELQRLREPIYVDRDMWEKIVLNLLSNALKFTFEGSISVALQAHEEHVELVVRDTGIGIPADELPHLFKRFHRVQGARARTHEGSGIGLAMVHELVRQHGGSIGVDSEAGRGTCFTLRIPRGLAHLPEERVEAAPVPSSTGSDGSSWADEAARWVEQDSGTRAIPDDSPLHASEEPARIVLADDNADMRAYVTRLLVSRWQVDSFANGAEALAAAQRDPPDLVLTDVMMPELDGFSLLRALRADARTRRVPVIMLSARAGEESRVEGIEAGADDYLVKPFSARELLARVATHLTLARLRTSAEQERGRLYDVLMQAPVPVAVLSGTELRYEVANASYCRVMGRDDLVGKRAVDVFAPAEEAAVADLAQVQATGEPLAANERHVSLLREGKRGEAIFDYTLQPLVGIAGAPNGVIAVVNDVTEQVRARRKLKELRETAERASRAKDDFLSTLSHELRTPLSAIVGWSTLLRNGAVAPERFDKALETIERNAKVQARLIEDMLDLARIEQGKLMLSVGPLEMVRVVNAAIESVRPAAEAKGVRLQPVLDSHATIVGDADRLQQVVWNLLSNAVKFTPKDGRVHVRLSRHHSYVELSVADTGQGIDPEFLPYMFDRFRQADASFARRAGGLGLGLAIVRSLIELHGGTVHAQSEGKDKGALFVVRLPTAPLRAESVPPSGERVLRESRPPLFEAPAELRGLSVLVVDDEPETRDLLKFVLEQCEVNVCPAESAREALARLQQKHFDVLVSDIGMPDTDGYALIKQVRSLPPEHGGALPALALTAYARAEDRTEVLRAGFNMHLAKPIDPSELLVVITTLVNSYLRRR